MDVYRITIYLPPTLLPSLPPYFFLSPSTILSLIQVTLFEISARLKLVSVPFSSLLLDIGHLEKSFPEGIMQSSEMGQSFYDSKSHAETERYDIARFSKVTTKFLASGTGS